MNLRNFLFLIQFISLAWTTQALASSERGLMRTTPVKQHALVIGINQYRHISDLEGTVNDARLLQKVFHELHVQLPNNRVLLNKQATRAKFLKAWQDMLSHAKPGDTLILTFSGHGGQQLDGVPFDERDNKEETLLFHDYNPNDSLQGRITDDELQGLFQEAQAYNIVSLIDACHSSGMVRSIESTSRRFRSDRFRNVKVRKPSSLPTRGDDNAELLPHVTLITAVESDEVKVPETILDDKPYGALSWFFAQALRGQADSNKNGRLERYELEYFLQKEIRNHMESLQTPKLLPQHDNQPVIILSSKVKTMPPQPQVQISPIAIVLENTRLPTGLKHIQEVKRSQSFDLRFVGKNQQIKVFNHIGDSITTLPTKDTVLWQRLIDKERLLKRLETQEFDIGLKPIRIILRDGDKIYKKGEVRHFKIAPIDNVTNLKALTIFNLAGNGELQFLYPLTDYHDPIFVKQFPYSFPPLKVTEPYGGDHLVAILCKQPISPLHNLLKNSQPNIPEPEKILQYLDNNTCQVGQHAFFSSEE
jgi:hypothetical protein